MSSWEDESLDGARRSPSTVDEESVFENAEISEDIRQGQESGDIELPVRPNSKPTAASALDEGDHEDFDNDNERGGRFPGPASTWRKYTQEERMLIASLDQQRANDLSIHLYNAHALKARFREPQANGVSMWSSKQRWIEPHDDGSMPFHPDRNWTAWPLPQDEVPRKDEIFGAPLPDDDATYRKTERWMPSAGLQDEIEALMLRKAKDRFRRRAWATPERRAELGATGQNLTSEEHHTYAARPFTGHDNTDSGKEEPALFLEPQVVKPVFLADDDQSHALLQPMSRHILAKFDELLRGLHTSRQGHRRAVSARSQAVASRSRAPPKSPAAGKQSRRRRPGVVAADVNGTDSSFSDDEESDNGRGDSPSRQKKGRPAGPSHHLLGLRDWSEILGTASLVGWNPSVIDRAARRCASLFGESMAFRVMPETVAEHPNDQIINYIPDMVPPISDSELESEDLYTHDATTEGLFCPYQACPRHHQAYDKAWRWREHLRRTHKLSSEEVKGIELDLQGGRRASHKDVDANSAPGDQANKTKDSTAASDTYGGVQLDGFLQPVIGNLGRGRDVKVRRRRGTSERESPKKRKIEHSIDDDDEEEEEDDDSAT